VPTLFIYQVVHAYDTGEDVEASSPSTIQFTAEQMKDILHQITVQEDLGDAVQEIREGLTQEPLASHQPSCPTLEVRACFIDILCRYENLVSEI
jgi:hypothetical protein